MSHIENVIESRLKLQSTQKELRTNFGADIGTIGQLKHSKILDEYTIFDVTKQRKLINILGGKANFPVTKRYLEEII